MRKRWSLIVLAAVVVFTCGAAVAGEPSKGQPVAARATAPGAEIRKFHITAFDGTIAPNTLRVKRGDKVRITFVSKDGTYGIHFKDFDLKDKVTPEKPAVIEFTPREEGTFFFRCTRTWGVKHWSENGTLVVE